METRKCTRLRKIINHKLLYKIVATQPETMKVLKELNCPISKIEYVFGVVSDVQPIKSRLRNRCRKTKIVNICFAAHKYDPLGRDKGLDLFIEVADELYRSNRQLKFHVVGPWESTIDRFSKYPGAYKVHQIIPIEKLSIFFSRMDVAVFPTRSDINAPGRFDGFPTATMVQAALAGCITISTNPLHQITPMVNGIDFLEIEPEFDALMNAMDRLMRYPGLAKEISFSAKKNFLKTFNLETQMEPRLRLLKQMNLEMS